MTAVGVVLTALALVLVVIGIVRLSDTVSDDALDLRNGREAVLEVREDIPDDLSFDADDDRTYAVIFFGDARDEVEASDLTVTGPDGQDVRVARSNMTYTSSSHSVTSKVASFETDDEGTYTLRVDGPSATVDGELGIIDDDLVVGLVIGAVSGVLLIVAGVITGLVGLGLGIGGGVWWSVRRSAAQGLTR